VSVNFTDQHITDRFLSVKNLLLPKDIPNYKRKMTIGNMQFFCNVRCSIVGRTNTLDLHCS